MLVRLSSGVFCVLRWMKQWRNVQVTAVLSSISKVNKWKWGIKIFYVCCSLTSYPWNSYFYIEKSEDNDANVSATHDMVVNILKPLEGKNHCVYIGCVYQPAAVNSPNSLLNAKCGCQVRLSFGTNIASEFNQFQLIQLRFFLYRRQSEQGGQKTNNHQLFLHSRRMQWSVNRQVVPGLCCPTVLSHNVPLNITPK